MLKKKYASEIDAKRKNSNSLLKKWIIKKRKEA
jgi:hypothetical protein